MWDNPVLVATYAITAIMLGTLILYIFSMVRLGIKLRDAENIARESHYSVFTISEFFKKQREVNIWNWILIGVLYILATGLTIYYVAWVEERKQISRDVYKMTKENYETFQRTSKLYEELAKAEKDGKK